MEEAKRVSIHVAEWNDPAALTELLASLEEQTVREAQVVAVDDGSGESRGFSPAAWPNLVRLRNFRRPGYARAHNQAIAFALTRWSDAVLADRFILLLDPHVRLAPDALEALVRAFVADPSLMMACPKVYRADMSWSEVDDRQVVVPTDVLESAGALFRKSRRPVPRGGGEADRGQYDQVRDVFGPTEACAMFRASALKQAELLGEWLDPELHRGQELADVSWRCQWMGLAARLVPEAKAYRYGPRRSGWFDARSRAERLARLERRRMESKNDTLGARIPHLPWTAWDACVFWLTALADPGMIPVRVKSWWPAKRLRDQHAEILRRRVRSASDMRKRFV